MGHAQGEPILSIAAPVLVMFVYLGDVWLEDRPRVQTNPFGDSFYYMGFLFTLIALAVTLVTFAYADPEDGTEKSVREVFTIFGMAVSTTIVGLCGRIVFTNFRTSPEWETRNEARQINAAAQMAYARLDALEKFSRAMEEPADRIARIALKMQSAAVQAQEAENTQKAQQSELSHAMQRSTQEFAEAAQQSARDIRDSTRQLSEYIRQHGKDLLRESLERITSENKQWSQHIRSVTEESNREIRDAMLAIAREAKAYARYRTLDRIMARLFMAILITAAAIALVKACV